MQSQIEASKQQHSASEVAELEGVKTSDMESVYNETINEKASNKKDEKNLTDE